MTRRRRRAVLRTLVGCAASLAPAVVGATARAQGAERRLVVVQLYNGFNVVDLLGDGHGGQIVVSRREHADGTGYSTALFQVRAAVDAADSASATEWRLIPFFGPDERVGGDDLFRSVEAGGCASVDLRVVRIGAGRPVQVVVARRAVGATATEPTAVRFDFYEVRGNVEHVPATPRWYFQRVRGERSRERYCDVNDAFARELGIGTMGISARRAP
ncbi:MAG TPA: hypothetical protein VL328_12070 [Gemmatimonadaceae bacterium]|nr:hypothetical protein [Gemmatimonadaceae bacterium]